MTVTTLVEAMALVTLVVFVFLQSWRATLIPVLAVPVSIIGTFLGLSALGFTINTLTLFGLVLAIGIVVDDAIVVVENIQRRVDEGEPALVAAERGTRQVFFELNGQPRSIVVTDRSQVAKRPPQRKMEPGNAKHVGAPMPGESGEARSRGAIKSARNSPKPSASSPPSSSTMRSPNACAFASTRSSCPMRRRAR